MRLAIGEWKIPERVLGLLRRLISWSVLVPLVASCSQAPATADIKEMTRLSSPDAVVDAVVGYRNTSATVSTPYYVYIVKKGEPIHGTPVMTCDHVNSLSVSWRATRALDVHYVKAHIFLFSNIWRSGDLQNWTYVVEVRLQPAGDSSI